MVINLYANSVKLALHSQINLTWLIWLVFCMRPFKNTTKFKNLLQKKQSWKQPPPLQPVVTFFFFFCPIPSYHCPKCDKTFFQKANYKIHFGTYTHDPSHHKLNHKQMAKYLRFNLLKQNKIHWPHTPIFL